MIQRSVTWALERTGEAHNHLQHPQDRKEGIEPFSLFTW